MPFIAVLDNHDALEFNTDDVLAELRRLVRSRLSGLSTEFIPSRMAVNAMSPMMAIAREGVEYRQAHAADDTRHASVPRLA